MRLFLAAMLLLGLLSACGKASRERQAADACAAEVRTKLAGKSYELDAAGLASAAKSESADTYHLDAPIVFDKGLASEYRQTIDCRVRFEGDKPSVIFLQFNWTLGGK